MPCWAPLLSLSHCLLLLCPSFSLFLKNLLSSSPQSSGPECPRHVRLRELLISHSPWPRRAALHICCDSLWKLNMCTEVPHQSCGGAGTVFIYLLTPEESYSPFIPPEPAAGLLLAQQVECELRSLCLPWGQERLSPDGPLAEPKDIPRGKVGPPQLQRSWQIQPASSFFLSSVPREGFSVLWQCPDKRNRHFSVSQLQLRHLSSWH